jgi:putative DNA primase/helicase
LQYQVIRYEPKGFAQRRPDGKGGWIWDLEDVKYVPYRLGDVIEATDVFVVEGEADADRLASEGLAATSNSGGAGKWRPEFAAYFEGKRVVIAPDNDEVGRRHAELVARNLHPVAASVKVLHLQGLPPKGDISDWCDQGHTTEELLQLVASTSPWMPSSAATSILAQIPNIGVVTHLPLNGLSRTCSPSAA